MNLLFKPFIRFKKENGENKRNFLRYIANLYESAPNKTHGFQR